jgi:hypothetical protein
MLYGIGAPIAASAITAFVLGQTALETHAGRAHRTT